VDRPARRLASRARHRASADALHTYYSGGLVSDGRQLAKLPIIDLRGNQAVNGDIHMNWRAWRCATGSTLSTAIHDNHLIWAYTARAVPAPPAQPSRCARS